MTAPPTEHGAAWDGDTTTDNRSEADDYSTLSNEELYEILCNLLPHMHRFPVSDLTRQTVIAMLRVTNPTRST